MKRFNWKIFSHVSTDTTDIMAQQQRISMQAQIHCVTSCVVDCVFQLQVLTPPFFSHVDAFKIKL